MGENFSRAFDITFNDVNNEQAYAHTTSWGLSTRFIGAIIMTHGDDKGLIMPPKLAPYQLVVVPIYRANDEATKESVMSEVRRLAAEVRGLGVRVKVDDREGLSPGRKFNEWEQKGVPLRVELGPKDLEKGVAMLADRLTGQKRAVQLGELAQGVPAALDEFHQALYERAVTFRAEHTWEADTYEQFKELVELGFVYAVHCGQPECEAAIQEETKATARCIPLQGHDAQGGVCIKCGQPSGYPRRVLFAKAY
jgi:prolyl-tRNA synthetase